MIKCNLKKVISLMTSVMILFCFSSGYLSNNSLTASAICCRKDGFDKSRYTLTGNMAQDVATIAKSQAGRTCSQFGYSGVDYGAWCDEYVADCLENAGCDESIVAHGGTVADFENIMKRKGAVVVSSPQPGDLIFFSWSHVEIVTRVENGTVYCAGGNNQGKTYPGGRCAGERNAQSVAKSMNGSIRLYLRPNYTSIIQAPNISVLSIDKTMLAVGGEITFTASSDYATDFTIGIDNANERYITQNMPNGSLTLTFDEAGDYSAYVTSYNSNGYKDSERVFFTVYIPQQGYTMTEDEGAGKTVPDGDYYIFSVINPDYYLDIEPPASSGSNISMYTILTNFFPDEQDVWTISYLNNGFYKIKQKDTNMCLTLENGSLLRGTNVQLYEDNNSTAQQWSIIKTDNGYKIQSRCSAYNLDVKGGIFENGTNVHVWEPNDTQSQRFTFVPYGASTGQTLKNGTYNILSAVSSEYCVNVDGATNGGKYEPETNINLSATSTLNDSFLVEYLGEGYYSICESTTGYALDLCNEKPSQYLNENLNIQLGSNHNGRNQKWIIKETDDGYYYIISALSGYYMNISEQVCNLGQNISQSPYNDCNYQKWKFVKASALTGDCNNDGQFSVADVVILQKWLFNDETELTNWQSADLDEDGTINVFDLCLMKQKLINK